jgi:hypothetical protein
LTPSAIVRPLESETGVLSVAGLLSVKLMSAADSGGKRQRFGSDSGFP